MSAHSTLIVSKSFAEWIKQEHERTNKALEDKLRKRMSFIDFTDFYTKIRDAPPFDERINVRPIKKGRHSKNVFLEQMTI